MQGEPKWFNTRQDVENWKTVAGDDAYKQVVQRYFSDRFIWVTTGELTENETGITDATHRVIEETVNETPKRFQQEQQIDANAYIFARLGFTIEECESILSE